MHHRKHLPSYSVLIGILLLVGQLGVLTHAVEHLEHRSSDSCQVFLQCEKSSAELPSNELALSVEVGTAVLVDALEDTDTPLRIKNFYARAPPHFS